MARSASLTMASQEAPSRTRWPTSISRRSTAVENSIVSSAMTPPCVITVARLSVFSSSRTLPGQSCASSRFIAPSVVREGGEPGP